MNKLFFLVFSILILFTGTGCNRFLNLAGNSNVAPVSLEIQQISPTSQPGHYSAIGSTNLPDQTQLTISAVRYLKDTDAASVANSTSKPYAILDREFVKVENGQWQSELSLWEVADNGRYQEVWQLDSEGTAQLAVAPNVIFLAVVEPGAIDEQVEQRLAPQVNSNNPLFGFTDGGDLYLQAAKEVPVKLPNQTATATLINDRESPWKDRSQSNPAADLKASTEMPFEETDNLPLPSYNQLQ